MQLIDLTVPLDWNLPVSPGHAPLSFKPIKEVVGTDGPAPRVVLRKS